VDEVERSLATDGRLEATIRVPDAIGDLRLVADLKARQTTISVDVEAPTEGRPKSRINWLVRQLHEAWPDLRIEVWYPHARESVAATLGQARDEPMTMLCAADAKRDPRSFTLALTRPMGQKRGRTEGSFVRETRAQAATFYRELVQDLKAWQARPPQIRNETETPKSAISSPDALPLMPHDVDNAGTRNVDMRDFSATADISMAPSERGEVGPAPVDSPADAMDTSMGSAATAP
jgi:hypothetical protein